MAEFNETVIDHISGDDWCGVSTGEQWLRFRLNKLAEKYPQEVKCIAENDDGSVYYHVPWKYVHIYRPRVLSESTKEIYRATVRDAREFKKPKTAHPRNINEPNLRENAEVE